MKKKWGVFLSFLFFVQTIVYAIDSEKIVKELKKLYGKELPSSFFVIQANTLLASFTQGPQIIKQIEDIRKNQLCPFIFMIWKDDGGVGKHFYRYVKENYSIDTNKFLKIYLSDTIYNALGLNHPNTAVHYFYNLTHYKTIDGKYERFTELLPYDLIKVTFDSKCLFADDNYYHTNQVSYFGINDTLAIELFDSSQDYIRLTNLANGKIIKIFDLSQIDYLDIFQNYMNYLNLSDEEVKQGNEFLKHIKRTPFKINYVYIKNANEIYLLGFCIIAHKARKKYYIPSEFKKETITLKPGDIITTDFSIIIKTDTSFKVKEIKIMDEIKDNDYNSKNFVDITAGFYLKDKFVYTLGYNYFREKDKTYRQFYKHNKRTDFIHKFSIDSLFLTFQEKGKARFTRPFKNFYFYLGYLYLFGNNESVFAVLDLFPEIYDYKQTDPVQYISEKKYNFNFKAHNYDFTTNESIPYYAFNPGYLLNNSILCFLYRSYDKFFLRIFDSKLHILQEIDITDQLHLKDEMKKITYYNTMVVISENFVQTIFCSSEGCFNYRYKIQYQPLNLNYFESVGRFLR